MPPFAVLSYVHFIGDSVQTPSSNALRWWQCLLLRVNLSPSLPQETCGCSEGVKASERNQSKSKTVPCHGAACSY